MRLQAQRDAHLGNVPRDGGTDEFGELVVAHLTPLRVVSNLIRTCGVAEGREAV